MQHNPTFADGENNATQLIKLLKLKYFRELKRKLKEVKPTKSTIESSIAISVIYVGIL